LGYNCRYRNCNDFEAERSHISLVTRHFFKQYSVQSSTGRAATVMRKRPTAGKAIAASV